MKTIAVLFLVLFLAFEGDSQTMMKLYENDYIQFKYPEKWELKENSLFIKIDIPDPSIINSSIQIRVSKTNLISPSIFEAMLPDMRILEYGEKMDTIITNIKSETTILNGREVLKIDRSNKRKG